MLLDALTPVKIGDKNEASTNWNDYSVPTELPDELLSKIDSIVDLVNL